MASIDPSAPLNSTDHWFLRFAEKVFTPSAVNPISQLEPIQGEIF